MRQVAIPSHFAYQLLHGDLRRAVSDEGQDVNSVTLRQLLAAAEKDLQDMEMTRRSAVADRLDALR